MSLCLQYSRCLLSKIIYNVIIIMVFPTTTSSSMLIVDHLRGPTHDEASHASKVLFPDKDTGDSS